LTHEEVRKLFDYDDRGYLIRKLTPTNRVKVGDIAGCYCRDGYYKVMVNNRYYKVHTLIFLWHNGYLPENDIDHINKCRSDNRIENLREASRSCNIFNSKMFSTNTSGVKGVTTDNTRNKFAAKIKINQKVCNLGRFSDLIEAAAHRLAAEQCLGIDACERSSAFECIENYRRRSY